MSSGPGSGNSRGILKDVAGEPSDSTARQSRRPRGEDAPEDAAGESSDSALCGVGLASAPGAPSLTTAEVCAVVGNRVRELRQALNMTMSAFAAGAGISLGMLSKIEHGQGTPSLSTLVRLAATAKVPLTALFRGLDEEHSLVIVRAGEGYKIHHTGDGPGRLYQDLGTLRGPNRVIEPMITTIAQRGGEFPLYQHPGVEFIHMLEGSLDYGYGGKAYRLDAGDTMQINGEVAHGPVELVELPVRFMSVKVYPDGEPLSAAGE